MTMLLADLVAVSKNGYLSPEPSRLLLQARLSQISLRAGVSRRAFRNKLGLPEDPRLRLMTGHGVVASIAAHPSTRVLSPSHSPNSGVRGPRSGGCLVRPKEQRCEIGQPYPARSCSFISVPGSILHKRAGGYRARYFRSRTICGCQASDADLRSADAAILV